ncbi:hypothetical protein U9M48_010894 [Paspalum notatum var. saurae]|uniref:DDE Tnp4 domain-containing protein n=1 Tax=Paspalum notatum var. saurae TaxID=547442 RepID=A0AAQ3WGQ9_PASNO
MDYAGAIDGPHLLARVPTKHRATFLERRRKTTHNVLVVVDFDLRFSYVLAKWEGSNHDALFLSMRHSSLKRVTVEREHLVLLGFQDYVQ